MSAASRAPVSESSRIAQLMGLPNWRDVNDLKLVNWVSEGLPVRAAQAVVRKIDPDERFLRTTDILSRSTLHRRKDQPLSRDQSEKVWAVARVVSEVLRLYREDASRAAMFLTLEHPMLAGRRPLDVAKETVAGADLVLKLLARADAGVAV